MTQTHRRTNDDPITDRRADRGTMSDVSHVHPHADEGALKNVFDRGPTIAADGGRRDAGEPDSADDEREAEQDAGEDDEDETTGRTPMKDVDHTPPYSDGAEVDRVFERGGKEEPVADEE